MTPRLIAAVVATALLSAACSTQNGQPPMVYGDGGFTGMDGSYGAARNTADNLWNRVQQDFRLPMPAETPPQVAAELAWFSTHQKFLNNTTERARPYLYLIIEEAERRNLPGELALLPVVESAFQPYAYSRGHASGIWQFVAGTGERYGLKQSWWYDGRRDIQASTRAAFDYLEQLNRQFNGDWLLALAAYNCGEGNVQKAVEANLARGKGTTFWDLDLHSETEQYVPRLLAMRLVVENPAKYGLTLSPIANRPVVAEVAIDSQLDLALAADLAGIPLDELNRLNPGFNRWATDPAGPHRLLLPLDKIEPFKQKLAAYPAEKRMQWQIHQVGPGENLGTIAARYNTTISVLRDVNHLSAKSLRTGKTLVIPLTGHPTTPPPTMVASAERDAAVRQADRKAEEKEEREERREAAAKAGEKHYTVRNGDTLWSIANHFKVSAKELGQWNRLTPRSPLKAGQTLVVRTAAGGKEESVAQAKSAAKETKGKATRKAVAYTVRRGDSLAVISQRFKVSVDDLVLWNPTAKGKRIQPGQKLTLYLES